MTDPIDDYQAAAAAAEAAVIGIGVSGLLLLGLRVAFPSEVGGDVPALPRIGLGIIGLAVIVGAAGTALLVQADSSGAARWLTTGDLVRFDGMARWSGGGVPS